ncbi:hypothetical protein [Changchengzhania lutea]|uniref:hypothetical protein n=1 Tax=Changchengzhania lutea TaxID=2049305 RepID=UPI00115EB42F|nr:hypothetical protein [Changchengzhania lutea]
MKLLDIEKLNFENIEKRDSVIIEFEAFSGLDVIHEIDNRLIELIPEELGTHDMHEIAMDDTHGRFFTYGKNAEELFKLMLPILKEYVFLKNAKAYLKFTNGNKKRNLEFKLSSITDD